MWNRLYIDPDRLHLLKPYKKQVTAYWLPEEDGSIPEAYVYQDETFICKATKVERFNESLFEQTEEDKRIQQEQQKRLAKAVKRRKNKKSNLYLSLISSKKK